MTFSKRNFGLGSISTFSCLRFAYKGLALVAFVTVLGAVQNLAAKEVRYKDYPLEIRESDQLVFRFMRGSLKVVGSATPGTSAVLRAKKVVRNSASESELAEFENLSFVVRRSGSALFIETNGSEDRSALTKALESNAGPEMHFELVAPAVPVEVSIRTGEVQAQNWKENLSIDLVDGRVKTATGEGALKIQIQRGEVLVDDHRGNVTVDSYAAKVTLNSVRGDLSLSNFAGDSTLNDVKGHLDLVGASGAMNIGQSSGSADFSMSRGAIVMTAFEGPVKGYAGQGTVTVAIKGEADIQVESEQAPVTVRLPASSGARLNLQTEDGYLRLPDPLQKSLAGARRYTGHLKGGGDKGGVTVKSKTGFIRIQI